MTEPAPPGIQDRPGPAVWPLPVFGRVAAFGPLAWYDAAARMTAGQPFKQLATP